jgi:hypothetical protein
MTIHDFVDVSTRKWQIRADSWSFVVWMRRARITFVLGVVKPTNDGRFTWFRKTSGTMRTFGLSRQGPAQGVCRTLEEAQEKAVEDIKHLWEGPDNTPVAFPFIEDGEAFLLSLGFDLKEIDACRRDLAKRYPDAIAAWHLVANARGIANPQWEQLKRCFQTCYRKAHQAEKEDDRAR